MLVKENINFRRGVSSKKALDIGLGSRSDYFGFGPYMKNIRDRKKGEKLWLTARFANMVLKPSNISKSWFLKNEFNIKGLYKGDRGISYACSFLFRYFPVMDDEIIFLTMGSSGDLGFDGGETSISNQLPNRTKDELTKQLYNHFLKIIDMPDTD